MGFFGFVPALVGFFGFVPALFFPLEFAIFAAFGGSFSSEYSVFVSAVRRASMSACFVTCAPDGLVMSQWSSFPSSSGKITPDAEARGARFGMQIPIAARPNCPTTEAYATALRPDDEVRLLFPFKVESSGATIFIGADAAGRASVYLMCLLDVAAAAVVAAVAAVAAGEEAAAWAVDHLEERLTLPDILL